MARKTKNNMIEALEKSILKRLSKEYEEFCIHLEDKIHILILAPVSKNIFTKLWCRYTGHIQLIEKNVSWKQENNIHTFSFIHCKCGLEQSNAKRQIIENNYD